MFSYGTLTPATYQSYGTQPTSDYPDLFKFYTVMPTRSTESQAMNIRRPVLYTSLNDGQKWTYESQSNGFYWANYCGNFYFDATAGTNGCLTALAHKSASSNYSAYKARIGLDQDIILGTNNWSTSSAVAYNTANVPNREICKNRGTTNPHRYFCIKDGGGWVYNDSAWTTANWTFTRFGLSSSPNYGPGDDGGFKHICVNPERGNEALVIFQRSDNTVIYPILCNLDSISIIINYATELFGTAEPSRNTFKYISVDYFPGIGYIFFYWYSGNNSATIRVLRTHDSITHELLPQTQYVQTDTVINIGDSNTKPVQYGTHGWYCPWTKEYFFCPNAKQVWYSSDAVNWTKVTTDTSASATAACQKFLTDGKSMVIATSGSAYYYSRDKGTTWTAGGALSPNGFNTARSTDTIVLPFKCARNIYPSHANIVVGYWIDSSGTIQAHNQNFYLDDYISVDPSTSYVFYGRNKTSKTKSFQNRIAWYDSSYNFISQSQMPTGFIDYGPVLATSPSNAAYARISCNIDNSTVVTEALVDSYNWYFAKESDFNVMTDYGDIVVN